MEYTVLSANHVDVAWEDWGISFLNESSEIEAGIEGVMDRQPTESKSEAQKGDLECRQSGTDFTHGKAWGVSFLNNSLEIEAEKEEDRRPMEADFMDWQVWGISFLNESSEIEAEKGVDCRPTESKFTDHEAWGISFFNEPSEAQKGDLEYRQSTTDFTDWKDWGISFLNKSSEIEAELEPTKKRNSKPTKQHSLWRLKCWDSLRTIEDTHLDADTSGHLAGDQEEVKRTLLGVKSDNSPIPPSSHKLEEPKGIAAVVTEHYNGLRDKGFAHRDKSEIINMRNLNNHIKSRIIQNTIDKIREKQGRYCALNVLDLCCGKGGDLSKWKCGGVDHVICADIAEKSIADCKNRYSKMRNTWFTTEFIAADCSNVSIQRKFKDPNMELGLASCQFGIHYGFESQPQAERMLANITDNLAPGGYFIGTTVDACHIIKRLGRDKEHNNRKFGNSIFSVEFPSETFLEPPPSFGAKYDFHLEGAVDCPEFLVDFPTLEDLAAKYGLKLVKKCRFEDFIAQERNRGRDLLSDYNLTSEEFEVVSLYLFFVFQKEGYGKDGN